MQCDIQMINLDGSDARLAVATEAMAAAGLGFRRLPAFDGRKLRPDELPLYNAARAKRHFGRTLTGGEVGCFLSHLEGARQFLATDAPFGLVLEDDLSVPHNAASVLFDLLDRLEAGAARKPWKVANLGEPARHIFTPLVPVGGSFHLMRAHYFPVNTTAILWTRDGAAAFLRDATEIIMPVDHWLRKWATAGDSGLAINPPLFPAAGVASEIDASGSRKAVGRGLHYFRTKQRRLWGNKILAWRHRLVF